MKASSSPIKAASPSKATSGSPERAVPASTSPNSKTQQQQQQQQAPPPFRQPLYRKEALGGVSVSQLNRWDEKNEQLKHKFEAGLDRGLRSWAALRRSLAAVAAGDLVIPETIPSRIKYRSGRTYYDQTVLRMTGAFLSVVLEEKAEREAKAAAAELIAGPASADGTEAKKKRKKNKGENDDENDDEDDDSDDDDDDDEDAEEEERKRKEEESKKGTKRGTADVLKNLQPPEVNILRPTFPALSIAQFEHMLRSAPPVETLLCAYNHFHWRYFDQALAAGISIETKVSGPRTGKTLLFVAVENGDLERVEYLLSKGANPNARDHRGDSPLHLSMRFPTVFHPRSIAAALLNKGANVNAQNKRGVTPLHRAVLLGLLDFVELLLKKRAKVFVFDNNNKLPIHYASAANESKVSKLMNQNVRFCGKRQHEEMWAYIMSRKFVPSIFAIVASACVVCKRKSYDCAALKKSNFRYWLYVHEVLAVQLTKKKDKE